MINLIDHKTQQINLGDIIKAENLETKEVFYYLYAKKFLYRYTKQGDIEETSFNNIIVDTSLSLLNNHTWQWTKLGNEDEVYNTIFK